MEQITYKGSRVAYYLSGDKKSAPVVLVHGFCEDSRMWDDWIDFLPERFYIRIDLPGFGHSELGPTHSIEYMADVVNAVAHHLGIGKFLFVGHSMGGYVGLAFAEKYQNSLAGLCLFHSHPYEDPPEKKEARLKAVDFIHKNGHILYVRQMIPQLFIYDYSKGYQVEVNRLIHYAAQYSPGAIIATLHAMRERPDRSEVLRQISCPVLFLIGEQDNAIPLDYSLRMSHLPARASIHIFPMVGHMGMFSAPRETSKAFKEFLSAFEF
jgi:pimeloyl-ACP methyl ester carboxylesterase